MTGTTPAVDVAAAVLGDRARRLVPIGPLTTYRVGGRAALFVRAESVEDLRLAGRAAAESGVPTLVLGRGSNMLVADDGFAGLVVELGAFAGQIDVSAGTVAAGAGVLLPVLARRTAAAGLTGLEWMVGIPGSVGGAVRMNAGGHGSDMASVLAGVHIVDLASGEDYDMAPPALGLRFRGSALGDHQVVVSARF